MRKIINILALCLTCTIALAQPSIVIESQVSASNGNTPLWLNANKYGLSSLNLNNGYLRTTITDDIQEEHTSRFDYGYGADIVAPIGYVNQSDYGRYTTHFIMQQLYADFRFCNLTLTVGAKQQPMMLRDNRLSSGAQTLGINSRPIPQVRVGLHDWWRVPGFGGWINATGHFAYGIMTDGKWEEEFSGANTHTYNKYTRYHEKAGYLRFGNTDHHPLSFTIGLECGVQFGGELFNWYGTDQNGYVRKNKLKLKSNLASYWYALIPGGNDPSEKQFKNAEGNQLGSWVMRFDWEAPSFTAGIYADHFFEDHSSMFLLDYDGYGSGENWDVKEDFRFFLYKLEDIQLGADINLHNSHFLHRATIEFINTKYQSGPIYHDHNPTNSAHLGGIDEYYNHSSMPGWQHFGQVIGNPLYRSPQYNTSGYIGTLCNRFTAWHFGIEGTLLPELDYRLLFTYQKGFGTYRIPYTSPAHNTSLLGELSYNIDRFALIIAYGSDNGRIYGENTGVQLTLKYRIK